MRGLSAWRLAFVLSLGMLGVLGGCGYRLERFEPAFGTTRITVMPFSESSAAGVSGPLAQYLVRALRREGFEVTPDAERAQGVLTGQIELVHVPGATLQTVQLYTVTLTLTAQLWGSGHEPLWQETVGLEDDFLPTDPAGDVEPLVTERRRRTTIARLTELAADRMVASLVEASRRVNFES